MYSTKLNVARLAKHKLEKKKEGSSMKGSSVDNIGYSELQMKGTCKKKYDIGNKETNALEKGHG